MSDFTTSFVVDQTHEEAFAAVNNVRGWWGEDVEVIPKALRDRLGLRPGAVEVAADGAALRVEPITDTGRGDPGVWLFQPPG